MNKKVIRAIKIRRFFNRLEVVLTELAKGAGYAMRK